MNVWYDYFEANMFGGEVLKSYASWIAYLRIFVKTILVLLNLSLLHIHWKEEMDPKIIASLSLSNKKLDISSLLILEATFLFYVQSSM